MSAEGLAEGELTLGVMGVVGRGEGWGVGWNMGLVGWGLTGAKGDGGCLAGRVLRGLKATKKEWVCRGGMGNLGVAVLGT